MSNDTQPNGGQTSPETQAPDTGLTKALWTLFSSMKTAIVLLLLLAIVSILGTVIEQKSVPEMYVMRYGEGKYAFLKALGLTDVYNSGWYKLLLSLIGINLLVCSINRFGMTWRRVTAPAVDIAVEAISALPGSEIISSTHSPEESLRKVDAALKSESYRVSSGQVEGDQVVHAARGNAGLWGPYLTHVSILIIFIGSIFGRAVGFEGYATIVEGRSTSTYERGDEHKAENLGYRVSLNDFKIEYDQDHNPTAYKSDLSVYEAERQVARKVIGVNHPLTYRGVSFFQSDYGLEGLILKITSPDGFVTEWPVQIESQFSPGGKEFMISGMPMKEVKHGGKKITMFVHDMAVDYSEERDGNFSAMSLPLNPAVKIMANANFPENKDLKLWDKLEWLQVGQSEESNGFKIELTDAVMSTGLQVSKNPGIPILYAGFILLMVGIFLSFYITRSIVRVRVSAGDGGTTIYLASGSRSGGAAYERVRERIKSSLV